MDRRYDILAMAGVRNIAGFNDKFEAGALLGNKSQEGGGRGWEKKKGRPRP